MSKHLSIIKFIIQSAIVGLAIGFLIVYFKPEIVNKRSIQSTQNSSPASYAPAVNKIAPSVVSIYTYREVARNPLTNPELQKFMGLSSLTPQSETRQYLGSGVVMSDDGYIVTNFHVIKNASQVIVSLWDNTLLEAKIIGSDSVTDIAVLKVEAINLKPAVFADSDSTQTGDIVMAVGNPYGLSQSVSLGIVSAKGRSGLSVSTIENFIQTDAAINDGNSGGALINANGDLVGISTANYNQNGAQGINFAIPSNATKLIMQEILKNGKVLRGWLGVVLYSPQNFYRQRLVQPERGVVIYTVYRDFPAHNAGLLHNDIITHINETAILDQRHYREIIARSKPGETLKIIGFSQGKPFTKQVMTIDRPAIIH